MEILLALIVCLAVAWFVSVPLRRDSASAPAQPETEDTDVADLEARKEALYRQIRDAELDRAQGKLTDSDWRRLDAELRREAIEVLRRLDTAEAASVRQGRSR